ncbi:MAG: Glu-tRNA(Gln) amidotransferase subunit GatE [Candidatus Diapherotrites archaeon]
MFDVDYSKLGLKCGLEIHQQIDCGKLFSRSPSILRDDKPDFVVERFLRPSASELGEVDRAALEAYKKNLVFSYEGYFDTISLVELDEEPPQSLDDEALKVALVVCKMLNANVVDEAFVMRKLVIDGSNTSGFQRTLLLATNGRIDFDGKSLSIQTIVLEEDAARPTFRDSNRVVYRLDRLGVPLIEIATEPKISSPEEAQAVAFAIGSVLRLTGKMKRGLGTIRQDLNVSIANGARVEIKGVQSLESIAECVRREVQRQLSLLKIKEELMTRGVSKSALVFEPVNVSDFFVESNSKVFSEVKVGKAQAFCLKVRGFADLLGFEVQPGRRLGTELAGYVRASTGLKGLIHSDELPNYGISLSEKNHLFSLLGCGNNDSFVLVVGEKEKALEALKVVFERLLFCFEGVPEETRGALQDSNTEYLRPLPGAARMYPETDVQSILVSESLLVEVSKLLPLSEKERLSLYLSWGLNEKLANEMKFSNFAPLFESLVKGGCDAKKCAVFLLETLVEAKRLGIKVDELSDFDLSEFAFSISSGKLPKEIVVEVLAEKVKDPSKSVDFILSKRGFSSVDYSEVVEIVRKIVANNLELVNADSERAVSKLMGDAMKELKGKVSGKELSELLKKEILRVVK